jgi:mannose-6-phosphate isomerase class I
MKPIKLIPVFKDYLWGGNLLKTKYNKKSDKEYEAN